MNIRSFLRHAVLSCAVLALLTGCPRVAPPENAVTWGVKATTGRLTQTTTTEWQAVAERIDNRTPERDISLDDAQAQAIVDFIETNDLNSIQAIIDLVRDAQNDPSVAEEITIPESVTDLFGDVDIDFESLVTELQSL